MKSRQPANPANLYNPKENDVIFLVVRSIGGIGGLAAYLETK